MSLYDLDPQNLNLVLELQLQDARALLKGKHREGEAPDTELAIEMYKTELEEIARSVSDRNMCRSIARAVKLDGDTVRMHAEVEQRAIYDRQHALNLDTGGEVTGGPAPEEAAMDDELLSKLKALYVGEDIPSDTAESSSWASKRGHALTAGDSIQHRSCTACCADTPFFNVARCPCSHEYCRECLAELFKASINDESLFPPRCCGRPIPVALNQILLSAKLVGEFRAKELEYATPNRTYCHQATCSTFIPLQFIEGDTATCVRCQSRTCIMCKGPFHRDDCPEDVATQELLRFATENGWQRCHSCHRVVELDTGCNHMSTIFRSGVCHPAHIAAPKSPCKQKVWTFVSGFG